MCQGWNNNREIAEAFASLRTFPPAKQEQQQNENILETPSASQTKSIKSEYSQYASHLVIGFVLFRVAQAQLKKKTLAIKYA